jgi:hypothetical protein
MIKERPAPVRPAPVQSQGKLRRSCPHCLVDVEVTRPNRALSQESTRKQRKNYVADLRRQVLWEGLCEGPDGCRAWWNALMRRIEDGDYDNGL